MPRRRSEARSRASRSGSSRALRNSEPSRSNLTIRVSKVCVGARTRLPAIRRLRAPFGSWPSIAACRTSPLPTRPNYDASGRIEGIGILMDQLAWLRGGRAVHRCDGVVRLVIRYQLNTMITPIESSASDRTGHCLRSTALSPRGWRRRGRFLSRARAGR
jgi:hypothetical protein